jgi:hypothetical protein
VIILDYRASVYLVASVDKEQQTQSRSTVTGHIVGHCNFSVVLLNE